MSIYKSNRAWRDIPSIHIGNRQDIAPWQTDPRVALIRRHKIGLVMVPPVGLDQFLSPDIDVLDEVQFIHGPKGSGKTSLLLAKRCLLEDAIDRREVLCVPSGFPFVFSPSMDSTTTINFETWESLIFADKETWKYVWLVLLGAYILNAVDIDAKQIDPDADKVSDRNQFLSEKLKKFVLGERGIQSDGLDETQWVEYLKNLIENTRSQNSKRFRTMYETEVRPRLKELSKTTRPIFLFVDGVDETFLGPGGSPLMKLVKSKSMKLELENSNHKQDSIDHSGKDPDLLARNIWINAQTSLISVASEFSSVTDAKVCMYGSMRSEAFREMTSQGAQARGQFTNLIKAIEYSQDHLEAIFMVNVLASIPSKRSSNTFASDLTIESFFGLNNFKEHQIGISESMFQYICRHTLSEPRDLMIIGSKFKGEQVSAHGNVPRIAEIIKKATLEILDDYFRFMDEEWDPEVERTVLPHISKNVITLEEARNIATQSSIEHPLCYLYKRGLIGVVEESADGKLVQTFQRAAVANEGNRSSLPQSAAYLVHPLLESRISNARASAGKGKFQLVPGMVVGNGLSWIPSALTKQVNIEQKKGRVSLVINRENLSVSTLDKVGGSFSSLGEVPTAILIACLIAMLEENTNTPTISDVLENLKIFIQDGYLLQKKKSLGKQIMMIDYLNDCLTGSRNPAPFETINDRLVAVGLLENKISRSLKNSTMSVSGFSWNEIEYKSE